MWNNEETVHLAVRAFKHNTLTASVLLVRKSCAVNYVLVSRLAASKRAINCVLCVCFASLEGRLPTATG